MSRGNYHLTIATTPEAPARDDVTPSRGRRVQGPKKNPTQNNDSRAFSEPLRVRWFFFSVALKDNYDCIF